MNWLQKQIEWIKSFFSEHKKNGEELKGSSKRVAALTVTYVFAFSYIKVALATSTIPDIPEGWRWVLLIVLGVTGFADVLKNKIINPKENKI